MDSDYKNIRINMTYTPIISSSRISKGYGYTSGGDSATLLSVTEKYDDVLNTWTAKANLNTARYSLSAFSLNGYGYTIGGYTTVTAAKTEKYDNISNTWTAKADLNTEGK